MTRYGAENSREFRLKMYEKVIDTSALLAYYRGSPE